MVGMAKRYVRYAILIASQGLLLSNLGSFSKAADVLSVTATGREQIDDVCNSFGICHTETHEAEFFMFYKMTR